MKPPAFLTNESAVLPAGTTVVPEPDSRRGEALAWLSAAGLVTGLLALRQALGSVPPVVAGAALFFTLVAALISFGNWMRRGTSITVETDSVVYLNPLRQIRLAWEEIETMQAVQLASGWRVTVESSSAAFSLRTAGELKLAEFDRMPTGMAQGEAIAATIRQEAGLMQVRPTDRGWRASRNGRSPA